MPCAVLGDQLTSAQHSGKMPQHCFKRVSTDKLLAMQCISRTTKTYTRTTKTDKKLIVASN